ncbi:MAG: hypothetical protein A3F16_07630 [Deltaproteobacteria bacterium RIFCSPHIGHO2_12_FULL_43_9]|nr:MAG: hypothetical protein A3F16_07630 [Deltaproteobacteria bacterium RIFCSPHIGHO2_12_FULL_43_9]
MKSEFACIECILDDVAGAVVLLDISENKRIEIMRLCKQMMAEKFNTNTVPSKFITEVHRIAKRVSGIDIPFKELRDACNRVGLKLAGLISSELDRVHDPYERFKLLIRWSIAGNHIDFRTVGTGYDVDFGQIEGMIRKPFEKGLAIDRTREIFSLVRRSKNILFVHDNVGEIALDKLFIKELLKYSPSIISALRGGAITSDATIDDGKFVGIHDVATEVICACGDTLGVSWEERTEVFKNASKEADLIIVKGQANYYVFTEHRNEINCDVANLFSTKCDVVASKFGLSGAVNIATLL